MVWSCPGSCWSQLVRKFTSEPRRTLELLFSSATTTGYVLLPTCRSKRIIQVHTPGLLRQPRKRTSWHTPSYVSPGTELAEVSNWWLVACSREAIPHQQSCFDCGVFKTSEFPAGKHIGGRSVIQLPLLLKVGFSPERIALNSSS
jgi:hypothetical protein